MKKLGLKIVYFVSFPAITTTILILMFLSLVRLTIAQDNKKAEFPDWIIGEWSNLDCSRAFDTKTFQFNKSCFHMSGRMIQNSEEDIIQCINDTNFRLVQDSNYIGLFRIKHPDTDSYEFKLVKNYDNKNVLIWRIRDSLGERGF